MPKTSVTYAGFNYLDRTLALQLGEVELEGVELRYVTVPNIGSLFRRMAQSAEFDVAEMSMSTLIVMLARGDDRLVGLPIFPSRSFRHGFMFVNAAKGITRPEQLRGKRVGLAEYQLTANLWLRAVLASEYGVAPQDVRWFTGGLDVPAGPSRLRHAAPPGVGIEPIPPGRTLEGMLCDGDLDAVFTPERLRSLGDGSGRVRRLLPNYEQVEREYFRRTGHFPIMHTVAMRRAVYERHPTLATALVRGFHAAKKAGEERMRRFTSPALALPWLEDAVDESERLIGDTAPVGFAPSRATIEAMLRYSYEQGLAARLLDPEELFAPETLGPLSPA